MKYIRLIGLVFMLALMVGCKNGKEVLEIPITILYDKPLPHEELKKIDSLYALVNPSDLDSALVIYRFVLCRTDLSNFTFDSIEKEASFLKAAQKWISGGIKNPEKYERDVRLAIEKFRFNPLLLASESSMRSRDSLVNIFGKNSLWVAYVPSGNPITLNGKAITVFNRIDSLRNYLLRSYQQNESRKIRVLFDPQQKDRLNIAIESPPRIVDTPPPSPPPPPPPSPPPPPPPSPPPYPPPSPPPPPL